jgi:hypothetical protein
MRYWATLSDLTHVTQSLEHLHMQRFGFSGENMEAFLDCLAWPSSISKLTLEGCWIGFEGMQSFKNFMETGRKGSPLRKLSFELTDGASESWSGNDFVSMFCGTGDRAECMQDSTIGSQILSLSLSSVDFAGEGLLAALAGNARRINWKHLKLSSLKPEECKLLALFISAALSLEELDLDEIEESILCSLRENGSLLVVSIPGERETYFANAYCLRNKLVDPLMQSLAWTESTEGETNVENVRRTVVERRALSVLPSLLQSAKQISATGASKVFSSLMNQSESIGPI